MATKAEAYIEEMNKMQLDAQREALESEYKANVASLDTAAKKVPEQYYESKRQITAQGALDRQRMYETMAANGLNTGARGQAALAVNNQVSANLAKANKAQADASAEIETQRTMLAQKYQAAVRQAIAESNYNKAQALYQEYQTQAELAQKQAQAILEAGAVPSAELTAAAGLRDEYIKVMRNYYAQQAAARYSGGGGEEIEPVTPQADDSSELTGDALKQQIAADARRLYGEKGAQTAKQYVKEFYDSGQITKNEYYTILNNPGYYNARTNGGKGGAF